MARCTPLDLLVERGSAFGCLPEAFQTAVHLNPFFYMIDGFGYGFAGVADGSLGAGVAVMAAVNGGLWALCHWMFASGYKLKA